MKVERWCTATRRSLTGAPRPVLLPDRPSVVVVGGYYNPYWSRPYNIRAAWARPYWDRPWCAAASVHGHGRHTPHLCSSARSPAPPLLLSAVPPQARPPPPVEAVSSTPMVGRAAASLKCPPSRPPPPALFLVALRHTPPILPP